MHLTLTILSTVQTLAPNLTPWQRTRQLKIQRSSKVSTKHTYVFQAAHEVVADWRSWKVSSVGTSTDVEEIVRAQHGIVLLCVTSGGQNAIH